MSKILPLSQPGTRAEQYTLHIPLYKVLLHNDDHNTMEHVIKALARVFKFEQGVCERIMLEAHQNGIALCTVEPLEKAEHHRDQLNSYSLISTIEPDQL
ncbi:MAG: ATP-dependent Clp protease adaptor ClpS [Nitrospirae bacterium]|nr:ATP-dependent Clp protease adaptor ClpS [Nitrospirota bacterium]